MFRSRTEQYFGTYGPSASVGTAEVAAFMDDHFYELLSQIDSFQQRLEAIANVATNLIAQLSELQKLRDRVMEAQRSILRSPDRRKRSRN
jgi:hypothetical protein